MRAKRAGAIVERLRRLNPETQADDFVSLAENLIRLGGRMPDDLLQAYSQAQQIFYLLPETPTEFAVMKIERRLGLVRLCMHIRSSAGRGRTRGVNRRQVQGQKEGF